MKNQITKEQAVLRRNSMIQSIESGNCLPTLENIFKTIENPYRTKLDGSLKNRSLVWINKILLEEYLENGEFTGDRNYIFDSQHKVTIPKFKREQLKYPSHQFQLTWKTVKGHDYILTIHCSSEGESKPLLLVSALQLKPKEKKKINTTHLETLKSTCKMWNMELSVAAA
ncbi:MAG TPA: hypothetical protein VGE63_00910 [Candidatus Paceibacterota bacterium]